MLRSFTEPPKHPHNRVLRSFKGRRKSKISVQDATVKLMKSYKKAGLFNKSDVYIITD